MNSSFTSLSETVSISIFSLGVVNCAVVIGNLLVLYVILTCKTLQTTTNRLVLSLTIADLLLGIFISPFAIIQDLYSTWKFGQTPCQIWLSADIFISTASIYNLLAISFDRYMAVRQPIQYTIISSTKIVRLMLFLVWFCPFILASMLFSFLTVYDGLGEIKDKKCEPADLPTWFKWFSGSVSFVIPGIVMIILNVQIFRTVVETSRTMTVKSKNGSLRVHRKEPIIIKDSLDGQLSLNKLVRPKKIDDLPFHLEKESDTGGEVSKKASSESPTLRHLISHTVVFGVIEAKKSNIINHITQKRLARRSLRTELRVARTTAIVVCAFIICWTPFATIYLLFPEINHTLFTIFFWLGYANSAVNPLLYAVFSREFRIALKRLFIKKKPANF